MVSRTFSSAWSWFSYLESDRPGIWRQGRGGPTAAPSAELPDPSPANHLPPAGQIDGVAPHDRREIRQQRRDRPRRPLIVVEHENECIADPRPVRKPWPEIVLVRPPAQVEREHGRMVRQMKCELRRTLVSIARNPGRAPYRGHLTSQMIPPTSARNRVGVRANRQERHDRLQVDEHEHYSSEGDPRAIPRAETRPRRPRRIHDDRRQKRRRRPVR